MALGLLLAAALAGPTPAPPAQVAAAPAASGRLAAVDGWTLAIPLRGGTVRVAVASHGGVQTVWIEGARLGAAGPVTGLLDQGAFRAVETAAGGVRIDLALAVPAAVQVGRVGAREARLQVVPLAPARGAGVATILAPAAFDAGTDALAWPYYGEVPDVQVRQLGATIVAVDVAGAALAPDAPSAKLDQPHPLLRGWTLARLPGRDEVRATVGLRFPGTIEVRHDPEQRLLWLVPRLVPGTSGLPAPARREPPGPHERPATGWHELRAWAAPPPRAASLAGPRHAPPGVPLGAVPKPPAQPHPPERSAAPWLTPTPSEPPYPSASATPAPAEPLVPPLRNAPQPSSGHLVAELGATAISEALTGGGLDVGPAFVPALGLRARHDFDAPFGLDGRLRYHGYTLVDRGAEASRHRRDDLQGDLWGSVRLPFGALGAGYHGRLVAVGNSLPVPFSQPLVAAPTHLIHGPLAVLRLACRPAPGLASELELHARPTMRAEGNEVVATLGTLFGYGAAAALRWEPWPGVALGAAYRLDVTAAYANDFLHTEQGPALTGAWRF